MPNERIDNRISSTVDSRRNRVRLDVVTVLKRMFGIVVSLRILVVM